jgi:DUF4097 and DUF4098 domain-containing protein YvlB
MKTARKRIIAITAFAAFSTLSALAEARGGFSRTLNVSGTPDVEVYTGSGTIVVRPGSGSTVSISARIQAKDTFFGNDLSAEEKVKRIEADPPIRQNGNSIIIGKIDDRELRRNVSIDYDITVPAQTKLLTETGSGDIKVNEIGGPLRAQTGSGSITAVRITGDARVNTGSGDVRLDDVNGRVYARTGSGSVRAVNVGGGIVAETGSGEIEFDQTRPGDVSARTGSGSIRLRNIKGGLDAHAGSGDIQIEGDATGPWDVDTGSGSITLRVPTANFDLRAVSASGSVDVDRPITVQGRLRRNRVEGKVGNGGVLLSLSTGSGDINIR